MVRALSRVVKDDPDGMPHAGSNAAHAVAEIHAIVALRPLYRAVVDSEGNGISLGSKLALPEIQSYIFIPRP
jgi:hypothetical protein